MNIEKDAKGKIIWTNDLREELRRLRMVEGQTYNQIGKSWGVSPNAVAGIGQRMGLPLVKQRIHIDNEERRRVRRAAGIVSEATGGSWERRRAEERSKAAISRATLACQAVEVVPAADVPPIDEIEWRGSPMPGQCCAVFGEPGHYFYCFRDTGAPRRPFCEDHSKTYFVKPRASQNAER